MIFRVLQKTLHNNKEIHEYILKKVKKILKNLMSNLYKLRDNFIIVTIGKMIRKLIKDHDYIPFILTIEYIKELYSFTKSQNFLILKEIWNILFYIYQSKKIDSSYVEKFMSEKTEEIVNIILNTLKPVISSNASDEDDKYYYMKRESAILLENIMKNPAYEKFTQLFTNSLDGLIIIMSLMNSKSNQIIIRSVILLNFFFLDIENKNNKIKKMLFFNKENIEDFFNDHVNITDIEEPKDFILYELERLGNLIEDE